MLNQLRERARSSYQCVSAADVWTRNTCILSPVALGAIVFRLKPTSVFNVFKSAIAYDTSIKSIPNLNKVDSDYMVDYEFEPDTKEEVLQVNLLQQAV